EILNAPEAENYGVELETVLRPLEGYVPEMFEGLSLTARFGWLHGEFLNFQNVINRRNAAGQIIPVTLDFSGNQLPNSPEYKVSGTVEWTLDLGRYGFLVPRYDFAWTDDVFFDANNGRGSADATGLPQLPEYAIAQKDFWLHNLRLAYRTPDGHVELAGW